MRHVLVHHHIFKNAGTTIDSILERNFGNGFSLIHGPQDESRVSWSDVRDLLGKHAQIRAVSSHHFHTQQFSLEDYVLFDMIFLRHPLDRIRSIYDFYRRENAANELVACAKNSGLKGFVELLVSRHPHQINNVQTNLLANHGYYTRPPGKRDLDMAIARMETAAVPGLLEMFDESLVAAEYYLAPAFPGLDLSYQSQNVSTGRATTVAERLELIEKQCGDRLYNDLLMMNDLELRLLTVVEKELRRRVRLVPDCPQRLDQFRQRCRTR